MVYKCEHKISFVLSQFTPWTDRRTDITLVANTATHSMQRRRNWTAYCTNL